MRSRGVAGGAAWQGARVLGLWALVAGCGGGSQELAAPPPYVPAATPEAATACPQEAAAAKRAREAALGSDGSGPADGDASDAAAAAVFALAECERRVLDGWPLADLSDLAGIRAARVQLGTVTTLYAEVARSTRPRWIVAGESRAGDAHTAWAARLRALDAGAGPAQAGSAGRGAGADPLRAELLQALALVDADAAVHYRAAVEAGQAFPGLAASGDAEVRDWLRRSCAALGRAAAAYSVCVR